MTVIVCWEDVDCCGEPLSFTVRVIEYDPAVEYVWVTDKPVAVDPSPNDQLNVYGDVPPLADALNVTC